MRRLFSPSLTQARVTSPESVTGKGLFYLVWKPFTSQKICIFCNPLQLLTILTVRKLRDCSNKLPLGLFYPSCNLLRKLPSNHFIPNAIFPALLCKGHGLDLAWSNLLGVQWRKTSPVIRISTASKQRHWRKCFPGLDVRALGLLQRGNNKSWGKRPLGKGGGAGGAAQVLRAASSCWLIRSPRTLLSVCTLLPSTGRPQISCRKSLWALLLRRTITLPDLWSSQGSRSSTSCAYWLTLCLTDDALCSETRT